MRTIFWPAKSNPSPTALTRLGRVLHWAASGLAACVALLFPAIATNGDPLASNAVGFVIVGFWVVALFFVGRALRYILSAE